MQMIQANDGTIITLQGANIFVSNGEVYGMSENTLFGPGGIISQNCSDAGEALGVVLARHGGRKA